MARFAIIRGTLEQLLISFCNTQLNGLGIGRYCFETDEFAWHPMPFNGAAGICASRDAYYVIGQRENSATSLMVLDFDLRPLATTDLTQVRDGHSVLPDEGSLLVVSTGTDEIVRVRWDRNSPCSEETVWAGSSSRSDTVHLNSIAIASGRMYVSCFGPKSGANWSDSPNGRIIDLTTGEAICSGLLHPHTLFVLDGQLHVLDSKTGSVLEVDPVTGGARERWKVSGYLRGAAVGSKHLYVATSAFRHRSKSTGQVRSEPPGADGRCLLHRIDISNGEICSRQLTPFGLEVYDLALAPSIPFQTTREDAMALRLRLYDRQMFETLRRMDDGFRYQTACDSVLHRLINEERNFLAAAFALERLLSADPSNADWQYHYGYCLLQLGAAERGIAHLDRALELGYDEFWTRFNLASSYFKTGQLEGAEAQLDRAAVLRPQDTGVATLLQWIAEARTNAAAKGKSD